MCELFKWTRLQVRLPVQVTTAILLLVYEASFVVASFAQAGRPEAREVGPTFTSSDTTPGQPVRPCDVAITTALGDQAIGNATGVAIVPNGSGGAIVAGEDDVSCDVHAQCVNSTGKLWTSEGSAECGAQSATAQTLSLPILPAKTPVMLRLKKNVYKKDAKPGQPVEFEVGFNVVVNGQVFIPSGGAVTGSVRQVDRTGKGPAKVHIDLGPTQTISGETVRLAWSERMTGSEQPFGVADAVFAAGETGALFPVVMPVLVAMTLFEKKVLLDKDAGCGWFSLGGCGVWVVAHVSENVALDPANLRAAHARYTTRKRAAEIELCQLFQSRNPDPSGDEIAFVFAFSGAQTQFKARLLQQAGDLDAAIEEYQQALDLKPDCPGLRESVLAFSSAPLHFGLAELLLEKRDFVHAIPAYRTAVQLDPKGERSRIGLIDALENSGDLDTALAEIKEANRIWPDNSNFHYLLGRLLVKKNDPDAAVVELQWALKKEKNHFSLANCELGRALELKGDLQAALAQYRIAFRAHVADDQCRAAYERLRPQLKK